LLPIGSFGVARDLIQAGVARKNPPL